MYLDINTPDIFRFDFVQNTTSAATCVRTVPRLFKKVSWTPNTLNLDIGGGRFSDTTDYLGSMGVENVVLDPYNSPDTLEEALAAAKLQKFNTATLCNVLCVINDELMRDRLLAIAANAIKPEGSVYIQVYEGNKTGIPKFTSKGWQSNKPLSRYLDEVSLHFNKVTSKGGFLTCSEPILFAYNLRKDGSDIRFKTREQKNLYQLAHKTDFAVEFESRDSNRLRA